MQAQEYDLDLDIDYPGGAFRGTVVLTATGIQGPQELDCEGLEVAHVSVDGTPVPHTLDAARGKLIVQSGDGVGRQVRIEYRGTASRTDLSGLYVSASGELPVLTTMMEPISCRRFMPCLDRPDQKAVFRVRVTTDPLPIVIANADLLGTDLVGGRKRWTFGPTPPMATYLLYLAVAPFETTERVEGDVRCIAATLPGKIGRASKLLALAGPLVRAYGEYYDQPYPLPKLHLVAVPDLWAGAMENWGAIAFPELGLLVDDETSPAVERWAMETLAHEIAHQWFGNLVTMQTFNDLWLNESFATFVAAKMEVRLGMRADAWSEFLIRIRPAYFGDSLESTHPIRMDIADPKTIAESTDEITYFKGASVVRMIDAYLGEEVFRQGVAAYLQKFRWGNARGEDLWECLAAVSGEPVTEVLQAWVEREGFPVVRVSARNGSLHFEQTRYQFANSHKPSLPWPIPLTVDFDGATQRILFRTTACDVPYDGTSAVRVNPGRAAFIRVWYDSTIRTRVVQDLPSRAPADRWAVINDAWAFLLSGDSTLSEYLELVRLGQGFSDYPSVLELTLSLGLLGSWIGGAPGFRAEARGFYLAQLHRLTPEARPGEPDTDGVLREQLMLNLARVDDSYAASLAPRFAEIDRLPAAQRTAVALAYARSGGPGAFDELRARTRSASDEDGAGRAALAMEGLPTPELLGRALAASLEPGLRTTVADLMIAAVCRNSVGRALAWAWLQENLRELERRSSGGWGLARLMEVALPLVGLGRREEVERFFARESFPEAANGIRKALEELRLSARLVERIGAGSSSDPGSSATGRPV